MQTDWLHMLNGYWYKRDKTYSGDFDLWPGWLIKHFNEIPIGEAIGSAYLM